ncbi:MAG: DNA polymerase domain-containing protein [Candidatus Woesearchaeota archaeon]
MKAWLMDSYRSRNSIVLWIKTPDSDIRLVRRFNTFIYVDVRAEPFLKKQGLVYFRLQKQTYLRKWKTVLAVLVPNLSDFERFVSWIEKSTNYTVPMYNADIVPEQMFFYEHRLVPCSAVEIENNVIMKMPDDVSIPLKTMEVKICTKNARDNTVKVDSITLANKRFEGDESSILKSFVDEFVAFDPDVIVIEHAFSLLPYLDYRLRMNGLHCPFHRWDELPIRYRGGKSYYTYGSVRYQDFAIRLHGRFLVDSSTMIGATCEIDAIIELCHLSHTRFQELASRSFGAVFQSSLVREMVNHGFLVPFKEKPVDKPISLFELMKSDQAAHRIDPKPGFHTDVAEIDFCSMFPWIIYNHNISADTILSDNGPFEHVPGIPVRISLSHKGLVPIAIKPILDRRMEYKKNPTAVNKARAVGLKWVLVTSYGYLRFREFKLGIARSHMAVCAYAREILLSAMRLAEEKGFEVVHGIVDSLYIKKKGIAEQEVRDFCRELEMMTGIPVGLEGIFKWIVFLPSVVDKDRPLPTCYYGVFHNGDIKARGIEIRKRSSPNIVKYFQKKALEELSSCSTEEEIVQKAPKLCSLLKRTIGRLASLDANALSCCLRLAKPDYKFDIPQKKVMRLLAKKGISVFPGQTVSFVFQQNRLVLPEDYNGKPDIAFYRKLLLRALFVVLQPFGFTKEMLEELLKSQTKLLDFDTVRHVFVPMQKQYSERQGLSERILARRLIKQGWSVWRGGLINIVNKDDLYPNVRKRYEKLNSLLFKHRPDLLDYLHYLCDVHHGMPDFICFRNGVFKFVECKLGHEQLSVRQKKCIAKLQEIGFVVEVHKLVESCTKARIAQVNLAEGTKVVFERQARLVLY